MSRWTRILLVAALLLGLAAYQRWLAPGRLAGRLPTGGAEWIWAGDSDTYVGWVNFFVYKDFVLEGDPPEAAELVIEADEGYWAFLNGKPVGSGGFRGGAELDGYDVAGFLRPGANRILVQLKSRRGVGGLLAALDLGAAGSVPTDRSWRMSRRYEPAMVASGFLPEDDGEVLVWGSPPIGSWGTPQGVVRVPLLGEQLASKQARQAFRIRTLGRPEWERQFPAPERRIPLGRWVVFDLGEITQGYVNVVFATTVGARGLIYTGIERALGPDSADPAAWFLAPPGRGSWSDVEPRRFRFVTVLADAEVAGLRVFETEAEWAASRARAEKRSASAFDFEPPPSGPAVEDEFWGELERVTGLAGREALESFPGG